MPVNKVLGGLQGPGGIKPMMDIAFPLMLSTSTVAMMMFIDRLYLKQVSAEAMNACLSGGFTSLAFSSFFIGVVGFSTALVAQHLGARQLPTCPRILTQTIIFSCLSIPIILALIPAGRWLLETAGLSIEEMVQAQTYLTILMAFNGLNLFRESLSGYFGGIGKTRVVLLSTLIMGLANVGANYVLIFGKLGFPALGIAGAGYGTVFAWLVGFLALCVVYFRQIQLPEYQLLKSFRLDLEILKKLVHFGFASGLRITLLIFAIDLMILAFQSYGVEVSTAITIVFTWIHTLFIPVLGLEIATMSLTGRFIGARDPNNASDSIFSGLSLASVYALIISSVCLFAPSEMVGMFLETDSAAEINDLALWGTQLYAFMVFIMAWSAILGGALRGAGDTYGTMTISAVFWWLQYAMVVILIRLFELSPGVVLGIHIFSSPLLLFAMIGRFRSGAWRKFELIG